MSHGRPARIATLAVLVLLAASPPAGKAWPASAERGEYIFHAAGCAGCHSPEQGGAPLSGGAAIETPFGKFYAPNITPDPKHGIGRWTDTDFLRALKDGIDDDGNPLYPVFPFTTYTRATPGDLLDLRAYLASVAPSDRPNRPQQAVFPLTYRILLWGWRWLNFQPGEWRPTAGRSAEWNRGAYLVEALAHCGECHTPRNLMGGLDRSRWMAGARIGGDTPLAPNLTPDRTGLGNWSADDIAASLQDGIRPGGGTFGGEMRTVVKHSTSHLTGADRRAIAAYLKALPPLPSAVPVKGR